VASIVRARTGNVLWRRKWRTSTKGELHRITLAMLFVFEMMNGCMVAEIKVISGKLA